MRSGAQAVAATLLQSSCRSGVVCKCKRRLGSGVCIQGEPAAAAQFACCTAHAAPYGGVRQTARRRAMSVRTYRYNSSV